MSGFKALNIESDDESDIEIDDTKELQIEDALKLYQNALKYHAEGPESFDLAAEAYEQLFLSDIFKYPESQTELRRIELYGPIIETEEIWQDGVETAAGTVTTGVLETGPSTLPQILHLSHKNYAQFKLEHLTARLEQFNVTLTQILGDATTALDHFVEALDKDATDLDLWRRTASVGEMLESKRVARFCLEAVLDGDDEGLGNLLALPGLDEGLAGEQLRDLVGELEDQLSLLQSSLPFSRRKVLSQMLKQRLSSYHKIVDRGKALRKPSGFLSTHEPSKTVLTAPNTWAEVGEVLLRQLMSEQHGTSSLEPGAAISFDLDAEPGLTDRTTPSPSPRLKIQSKPLPEYQEESGFKGVQQRARSQIASVDADMQDFVQSSAPAEDTTTDSPTITLPTRKRSGDTAGINDSPDEGRTKSKRTRTRDSTIADDSRQAIIDANTRWEYEQQLNEFQAADDWMFETVGNLFERIGVVGFEAGRYVRQELQSPGPNDGTRVNGVEHDKEHMKLVRTDLHAFLNDYSDQLAQVLLNNTENFELPQGYNAKGFGGSQSEYFTANARSKPAPMPNHGLVGFLRMVNKSWLTTQEVAWKWLCTLLRPQSASENNTYNAYQWSDDLKTMIVRNLVNFDESVFDDAKYELECTKQGRTGLEMDIGLVEMVQTIFELHLDIYCLIKESNSGVDAQTISAQSDRLQRWSELARELVYFCTMATDDHYLQKELKLRFLWATTLYVGANAGITQEHVIECMNDLRAIFVAAGEPSISLQNNAIMPELSVAALDREISRLTTRDFFLKVTSQDVSDPVAVIETLEPLLDALNESPSSPSAGDNEDTGEALSHSTVPRELVLFLKSSNISVRTLLWNRLRDAYIAIDYRPMVLSCYFKMIGMLMNELKSTVSTTAVQKDRQIAELFILRLIKDITIKALSILQSSKDALECIDGDSLKAIVSSLGEVLQLLQVFNVSEDSIRVGQSQPPKLPNGMQVASYSAVTTLIHELQLRIWFVLYILLKEAIFQFHELFPNPTEDKFEFLRVVHRNLGLRGICGGANRMFVRMLKEEFFQMIHVEGYDSEQAQVLYDLYGLNCFLNPSYELIEHQCTHDAFLEKSVALQAVDLLMQQAAKLPMKDLVKHSIKETIEKVHGAIPRKKPTDVILRNREIYRSFLRSPINPVDLFQCLNGEGNQLAVTYIPKDDALLASKGWYFLMGHIALAKFRSQKRTAPTPTEDVDIAIAFFMQDLEYSMENWETWFRLAQAYDTKIEESVVWSAEKLNNSMLEVTQLQRAAIHCYAMATALAYRSAEMAYDTSEKMTELCSEFAMRLYASSREPFDMQPFALEDTEKFLSLAQGVGKGKPYRPLRIYTAWKLAKVLFQRALDGKPESWMLHFMMGKCLWKMYAAPQHVRGHDVPPTTERVLKSFIRAIELIPDRDKKDSREKREPVLEPHYKLVSIVHKILSRGGINLDQAREALESTPYARTVRFPQEPDEWVPYILSVLKALRAADKSNWHHRMVARAAQIVYDDSDPRADPAGSTQDLGAIGAKHELTQQMFTKTMVLQVWRPDSERAGRHFVYTARYTRFFVRILEQLKDRSSLEMLARRVRRRPHDVFEHSLVWQDICNPYLRLLRSYSGLPEGLETSTFSNIAHEDFLIRKEPLEKWMQTQETGSSPALDVLREVQELKKINASLMKPGPIDDLIGDSYAHLFNTIGRQLWDEERRIKHEEEARRPTPVVSPPRNPMMSLTHLMNVDGAQESAPKQLLLSQVSAPPQSDQAPARRKIGVGRREIRTCAEACFQKTNTVAASASTLSSKNLASLPRVQVVIESSRPSAAGDASVETSAPGSIHDSADDESELSELEEEGDEDDDSPSGNVEEPRLRPMFPGLASRLESREASEGFESVDEEVQPEHADIQMGYQAVNVNQVSSDEVKEELELANGESAATSVQMIS